MQISPTTCSRFVTQELTAWRPLDRHAECGLGAACIGSKEKNASLVAQVPPLLLLSRWYTVIAVSTSHKACAYKPACNWWVHGTSRSPDSPLQPYNEPWVCSSCTSNVTKFSGTAATAPQLPWYLVSMLPLDTAGAGPPDYIFLHVHSAPTVWWFVEIQKMKIKVKV
jgi:hypothetical protein